jgi:hypothetical protein
MPTPSHYGLVTAVVSPQSGFKIKTFKAGTGSPAPVRLATSRQ